MRPTVPAVLAGVLGCATPATPAPPAAVAAAPDDALAPTDAPRPQAAADPARPDPPTFTRPATWPAALVFPPQFDPEHAEVTEGPAGDLRVEHYVAGPPMTEVLARWNEALGAAGYTPREPCVADEPTCLYAAGDRLAVLEASANSDATSIDVALQLLPVAHVPVARLPGKCVTPPVRHREITVHSAGIDQQGEFRRSSTRWAIATHPGPDLDGDARGDVWVPQPTRNACPWEVPHEVYVMRGDCGHLVGTVVGHVDVPTRTAVFRRGLREVHTIAEWASGGGDRPEPEHHTRKRVYAFDGRRLKQIDGESRNGVCHHCGVSTCTDG